MPAQGRLGDRAQHLGDAHGCPACPHDALGPAVTGARNVFVNGRPALRVQDAGVHAACCGSNTWTAMAGSRTVRINGLPAHRHGDTTQHCGGQGRLFEGSPNVFVGDSDHVTSMRAATASKMRKPHGIAPNNKCPGGPKAKIIAKVIAAQTTMFYQPDGREPVVPWPVPGWRRRFQKDSVLHKGRYVVVQKFPGEIDGYVWVEADLSGFKPSEFEDRIGNSRDTEKLRIKAFKTRREAAIGRRGWVLAEHLRMVKDGKLTKLRLRKQLTPEGNSKPVYTGREFTKTVRSEHYVRGRFDTGDGHSYQTFSALNDHVYICYNTAPPQGYTFGYLGKDRPFVIVDYKKTKVFNEIKFINKHKKWYYGYASLDTLSGRKETVWGWVLAECLR